MNKINLSRVNFALTLLICLSQVQAKAQSSYSDYIKNSGGLCTGIFFSPNELVMTRTPNISDIKFPPNVVLPSACVADLNEKLSKIIDRFIDEDWQNMQRIVNSYCSHMKGWVEYNPGECSAGGPPPVCPANHWYQNAGKAMDEFYKERNKVFNERMRKITAEKNALMEGACNCWLDNIKITFENPTSQTRVVYQSDKNQSFSSTEVKIPCLNGCPIGFKCIDNYCVESTTQSNFKNNTTLSHKNQEKVVDMSIELAIDLTIEKILDKAEKNFRHLPALRSYFQKVSPVATVVGGVFELTDIGTYSKIYQKELSKVQTNVYHLDKLYDQYSRYKQNRNLTKNINEIKNEIALLRSEIGKQIFNLNLAADGIQIEKELGRFNCYNVLKYNNQLVVNSLNSIISKPME